MNTFRIRIIIILIFHDFQSGVSENCSTEFSKPFVKLGSSIDSIYFVQHAVYESNFTGGNRYLLTCSHPSKPVRWELYSPDPDILDITLNLYWRNSTTNVYYGNLAVIPKVTYKDRNNLLPLVFICHIKDTSSGPCSTRSYLYNSFFTVEPVKDTTANLLLPQQSLNFSENTNTSDENACDLILRYRVRDKGNLEYKWENPQGKKANVKPKITKTASPDYFNGLYANHLQMPTCVRPLELHEGQNCSDCKLVGRRIGNEVLTAVIFRGETPMKRPLVAKGVFDVIDSPRDQREFHWEWDIPLEKMLKVSAPSVFYINKTQIVTCTISAMFFALGGGDLNLQSLLERNKSLFNDTPRDLEMYKPGVSAENEHGMREITRPFVFHEEEGNSDSIVCTAPLIDFSDVISRRHNFSVVTPEAPVILQSISTKKRTLNKGDFKELTCRVKGKPLPIVKWTFPTEGLGLNVTSVHDESNIWETISKIFISDFRETYEGIYKCSASNYLGTVSTTFSLQLPQGLSTEQMFGFGIGLGSVVTFFALILGGMYGKILFQRQKYHRETFQATQEFLRGIPGELKPSLDDDTCAANVGFSAPFVSQPFDNSLDVPFENWTIDDDILGTGNFGLVRKGRVRLPSQKEPVEVAVKTLISAEDIEDFKRFLYEIKLMKSLGFHPNIVCLVASCVERIDQRDVMIGVELCTNGSLADYLQKHASKLKQFVQDASSQNVSSPYKNLHVAASPTCLYANLEDANDLTDVDLFIWSLHIATGMEFLASRKVLHGDLAVRNVLITSNKTAKISDFGLSRHLDENSKYKKRSKVGVPWKYMPMESLTSYVFSTESDVWGYGVTVWEIFSLGQTPYAGIRMGPDFVARLNEGMRLSKPIKATSFVYQLMSQCWHENPAERPSFSHLKHQFASVVEQLVAQTTPASPTSPKTPIANPRRTLHPQNEIGNQTNQLIQHYSNVLKTGNLYFNC